MVQKNCVKPYNSIFILGPTACGKTSISIQVAKQLNGEIISADSMQFYKHLDIGTAKATRNEQKLVKHHCIDILELNQDFNVVQYRMKVEEICKTLINDKKLPIIVGGSGFYVKTLLDNDFKSIDLDYAEKKSKMEQYIIDKYPEESWYTLLKEKNIEYANLVHPNNKKRVLSYLSKHLLQEEQLQKKVYESHLDLNPLTIVLCPKREVMYDRINSRVDQMIQEGLLEEAKMLLNMNLKPNAQCLAAIGYKELFPYLKGEDSLEHCVVILKQKTRNYAKRQITWLKHQVENAIWIDPEEGKNVVDTIVQLFLNHK